MTVEPCAAPCLAAPGHVSTGGSLTAIETALVDPNNDLDVLATDVGGRLIVLPGKGDGTFLPANSFPINHQPVALAVGDLNEDGRPDVVTGNRFDQTVSVLLNDGLGNFPAVTDYTPGPGFNFTINSVAIADMTNDGHLDIVAAVGGSVAVLAGDGLGHFAPATLAGTLPFNVRSLGVANLDGDSSVGAGGVVRDNLDVVTVHINGGIEVLYGDGTGAFSRLASTRYSPGELPGAIALADLNGDNKPDLAVPDLNNVFVLLNDGSGRLAAPAAFPVAAGSSHFAIAARISDLTGDGRPDLAIANSGSSSASVFFGNLAGNLVAARHSPLALGGSPQHLAVGDLNHDGLLDLVTANAPGGVSVLLNRAPF